MKMEMNQGAAAPSQDKRDGGLSNERTVNHSSHFFPVWIAARGEKTPTQPQKLWLWCFFFFFSYLGWNFPCSAMCSLSFIALQPHGTCWSGDLSSGLCLRLSIGSHWWFLACLSNLTHSFFYLCVNSSGWGCLLSLAFSNFWYGTNKLKIKKIKKTLPVVWRRVKS